MNGSTKTVASIVSPRRLAAPLAGLLALLVVAAPTAAAVFPDTDTAVLQVSGGYSKDTVTWASAQKFKINYYVKDTLADGYCARLWVRVRNADGTYSPWENNATACGNGTTDGGPTDWITSTKQIYQLQFKLVVGSRVDYYNVSPGGA